MAVAEREALSTVPSSVVEAFTAFIGSILALTPVRRVDTSHDAGQAHWWIFVDDDSDEVLDSIYGAEFELRRQLGAVHFDIRVLPMASIDMTALPHAKTFIAR